MSPDRFNGPPALVVGLERNGLGVSRALAQCGIDCVGICGTRRLPEWSTHSCVVHGVREWSANGLVETMLSVSKEYGEPLPVLITKDQPVVWLSHWRDSLKDAFLLDLPSTDVVDLLMSKRAFELAAQSMGLPTPQTISIESAQDLDEKIGLITYPAILKPQVKNDEFRAHTRQKAYRIQGESALRAAYAEVAQWEPEVIVQEWVSGPDANVAFCLGHAGEAGRFYFAGRKLLQYPVGCGNTALCEPAPSEWEAELTTLTDRLWQHTDYRGLGSLECKFDDVRRRFVIMEPTVGRTNFQNELAVLNGVNLPAIAYFSSLGAWDRVDELVGRDARRPIRLSNWAAERRSAVESIRSGHLRVSEWLRMHRGPSRTMLLRRGDLMPFVAFVAMSVVAKARGLARRITRLAGRCRRRGSPAQ